MGKPWKIPQTYCVNVQSSSVCSSCFSWPRLRQWKKHREIKKQVFGSYNMTWANNMPLECAEECAKLLCLNHSSVRKRENQGNLHYYIFIVAYEVLILWLKTKQKHIYSLQESKVKITVCWALQLPKLRTLQTYLKPCNGSWRAEGVAHSHNNTVTRA